MFTTVLLSTSEGDRHSSQSRSPSPGQSGPRRRGFLTRGASAFIALSCILAVAFPGWASDDEIPVVVDDALSSALIVQIDATCSDERPRGIDARFGWEILPSEDVTAADLESLRNSQQLSIDLSMYPRGIERGDFERITLHTESIQSKNSGDGRFYVLEDFAPGVVYSARLVVLTDQGWVPSGVVQVRTPICFVDFVDEFGGGEQ